MLLGVRFESATGGGLVIASRGRASFRNDIISMMDQKEIIFSKISKLSEEKQSKVINFIELLSNENLDVEIKNDDINWSEFSLLQAMKGLEDEADIYSLEDIKIKYSK
jgi:hypothetical protein